MKPTHRAPDPTNRPTKAAGFVSPGMFLFRDIPMQVREEILARLRDYSIGFTLSTQDPQLRVKLLGSGTLVRIGTRHLILTAHHVAAKIPKQGRVGVLIDSANHPQSIDCRGVHVIKIARGKEDSVGPDLGAVLLSETIASMLRARKRFFDLEKHRSISLNSPPNGDDGMWVMNGFVDEWTQREKKDGRFRVAFKNQSGMGIAERRSTRGSFDYFFVPVSVEDRASFPANFGGMSGGGLWHVPFVQDKVGNISARPPILQGVNFYQVKTTRTRCGLRCHGPRSVYKVAFEAIEREAQLYLSRRAKGA